MNNTYIVQKGDTLIKIGKKLSVDWKEIASINNIKAPYIIKVGQVLQIKSNSINTNEKIELNSNYKMVKPVDYKQTDSKWKALPYAVDGEKSTIGSAGCGPSTIAMVLASLTSPYIDPITTSSWARMKGYKVKNSGTAYSYFEPQAKKYGVNVSRLNTSNLYNKPNDSIHVVALNELLKGNWIIACMGKGNWTSSGHYILVYGYKDGNVYINDPGSSKSNRACNTWDLFKSQVKYYWSVEVPENIKKNGIVKSGSYEDKDFIREIQYCCGAGLDEIAGSQTLSKTVTVSNKTNNKHFVVLPLQKKMKVMGYYNSNLDCIAGNMFRSAVINIQKKIFKFDDSTGEITEKGSLWKWFLGL